jgi:hypothetical protein
VDFYKILEVASITVVIKWAPKVGSKKGNLLPWMRKTFFITSSLSNKRNDMFFHEFYPGSGLGYCGVKQ